MHVQASAKHDDSAALHWCQYSAPCMEDSLSKMLLQTDLPGCSHCVLVGQAPDCMCNAWDEAQHVACVLLIML